MKQKHIFIIKPSDDNEKIEKIIDKVMQGYDYELKYTKYPNHATKIALKYRNCHHRIYAVGGDGLIHEVVQGLVHSENELVVIPNGTGNDFIRSIASINDIEKLLSQSLKLKAESIDLIKANEIYCINVFCCAFDSDVANNVHQYHQFKILPKSFQYINVLFHRLFKYHLSPVKLYDRGKKIYDQKLIIGAFCNGQYFGGGFKVGKYADLQNGLIDINLVAKMAIRQIPYYLILFLTEKLENGKQYYHRQVKKIEVETKQKVNIDGEVYPSGRYKLEIVKSALKVVLFAKND